MANMDDGRIFNPDMEEWTVNTAANGYAVVAEREVLPGVIVGWTFDAKTEGSRIALLRFLDADRHGIYPSARIEVRGQQLTLYRIEDKAPMNACFVQCAFLAGAESVECRTINWTEFDAAPKQDRNPTTRGYEQPEPITLAVELEPADGFDAMHGAIDPAVEIEFTSTDDNGDSKSTIFRGGMVEADGLTWWERRIREPEAAGRGDPMDEDSHER